MLMLALSLLEAFKLIRPHPNECSGGDLDGDLFFITWDDKLIPEKVDAPMDYTATRPRIMDHAVTLEVHSLLLSVSHPLIFSELCILRMICCSYLVNVRFLYLQNISL
jgi:hypothetical protein